MAAEYKTATPILSPFVASVTMTTPLPGMNLWDHVTGAYYFFRLARPERDGKRGFGRL